MRINWNGCPRLPLRRRALRAAIKRAQTYGLVVTATTNGKHAANSYHALGRAVDVGLPTHLVGTVRGRQHLRDFQHAEFHNRKLLWVELLGPCNRHCRLKGVDVVLKEHSTLEDMHDNHVHLAR